MYRFVDLNNRFYNGEMADITKSTKNRQTAIDKYLEPHQRQRGDNQIRPKLEIFYGQLSGLHCHV